MELLIVVLIMFVGGVVLGYVNCKSDKDKDIEKAKAEAMTEGYKKGYQAGYQTAVSERVTPNMLRAYLGLDPLPMQKGESDNGGKQN